MGPAVTRKDIVREIIELFLAAAPETFSEDVAVEIERQIRHKWGGEEVRIAKRTSEMRRETAAKGLRDGKPLQEIRSEAGISRATLYRLIGRSSGGK